LKEPLAPGVVNVAFKLPCESSGFGGGKIFSSLNRSSSDSSSYLSGLKFAGQAAVVIVVFFVIFGRDLACSTAYEPSPVKKISAGPPPLTVGVSGKLNGKNYRVTAHAVVEIAEVGAKWERHEYQLTEADGQPALLVCGLKPGDKNWTLFTPLTPLLPPTAKECAAKKLGDMVNVDGVTGPVREMFRSTLRQMDGNFPADWQIGNPNYGYLTPSEYSSLLVRWDQNAIRFWRGKIIFSKGVVTELLEK
jgi:hypothetical protein